MESHLISIHHIGVVVSNIRTKSEFYVNKLGYRPESGIVHETNQQVLVQFLTFGNYRIELIQPVGEDSPVYRFLQKQGVINHLCYQTDDIDSSVLFFRKEYEAVLTSAPEWSCSIDECRVAFLAKPDGEVIELVQLNE